MDQISPSATELLRRENHWFGRTPSASSDWQQAVSAASGRVNEKWILSLTGSHPAVAGMGEELAAFMCAYGML